MVCSQIHLDNKDPILGYVSRKTRRGFIHILLGDRVKMEVSNSVSTRRYLIYRLRKKDSND
uniref:initial transcription factor n=1 Tax=Ochna serrulata TaxID=56634 RepID=UPI0023F3D843|nr:initial transcription factor [Ochna serrulata]WEG37935.1 initial transcription factor [Ochna serrulata]